MKNLKELRKEWERGNQLYGFAEFVYGKLKKESVDGERLEYLEGVNGALKAHMDALYKYIKFLEKENVTEEVVK